MHQDNLLRLRYVAQTTSIDLVAILDVSGSISSHELELEKSCALALSSRSSEHQVAAIQFSDTAEVLCHLTSDYEKFDEGLMGITHTRGGTNLASALTLAADIFSASKIPNNKKKAYVFTDGLIDVGTSARSANVLKRLGCEIVVIGVGPDVSEGNLRSVASLNRIFGVGSFGEALKLIENKEDLQQDSEIQVVMARVTARHHLLSDPEIVITIHNSGSKDLPAGIQMSLRTKGIPEFYRRKTITVTNDVFEKESTIEIHCTLLCTSKTLTNVQAVQAFPSVVSFTFSHQGKWIMSNADGFFLDWRHFCSDLHIPPPSPQTPTYNILLFGPMGSGKSSFVNSLKTTLSNRVQNIAHVDNKQSAVTQALGDHLLFPAVTFLDCPGWEEESIYQNGELRMVLEGVVPFGTDLRRGITFNDINRETALEEWQKRVHCVAMIVDVQHVGNPDQLSRLTKFLAKIKDTERPVFLVGTHGDVVEKIEDRKDIARNLEEEVAGTEVLLAENYVAGDDKDFEKERKILVALYRALELSDDFMEREQLAGGKRVSLMYRKRGEPRLKKKKSGPPPHYSRKAETAPTSIAGEMSTTEDEGSSDTRNTPWEAPSAKIPCTACRGDGYRMVMKKIRSKVREIPEPCSTCGGEGEVDGKDSKGINEI